MDTQSDSVSSSLNVSLFAKADTDRVPQIADLPERLQAMKKM